MFASLAVLDVLGVVDDLEEETVDETPLEVGIAIDVWITIILVVVESLADELELVLLAAAEDEEAFADVEVLSADVHDTTMSDLDWLSALELGPLGDAAEPYE